MKRFRKLIVNVRSPKWKAKPPDKPWRLQVLEGIFSALYSKLLNMIITYMTVYCNIGMTFTMKEMSSIVCLNRIKHVIPVLDPKKDKSSNLCVLYLYCKHLFIWCLQYKALTITFHCKKLCQWPTGQILPTLFFKWSRGDMLCNSDPISPELYNHISKHNPYYQWVVVQFNILVKFCYMSSNKKLKLFE